MWETQCFSSLLFSFLLRGKTHLHDWQGWERKRWRGKKIFFWLRFEGKSCEQRNWKKTRGKKTFVCSTKMFWTLFSANQLVCFFLFAWISSAPSFFAFLWRKNSFRFCWSDWCSCPDPCVTFFSRKMKNALLVWAAHVDDREKNKNKIWLMRNWRHQFLSPQSEFVIKQRSYLHPKVASESHVFLEQKVGGGEVFLFRSFVQAKGKTSVGNFQGV